jgi:alpha-D-ribose 1-methylphosphonate 5-triphosphate diphosphatase
VRTLVRNGQVILNGGALEHVDVLVEDGSIAALDPTGDWPDALTIDAAGKLVAPGIVDVHGDSFETQVQPRPKARFPLDLALRETARQFAMNGITTAYLAQGCSWEGGIRGTEQAAAMVAWRRHTRDTRGVDIRLHIRHEIHNLDAVPMLAAWMENGDVDLVVFNDHLADYQGRLDRPETLQFWAAKAGTTVPQFIDRIRAAAAAAPQIEGSLRQIAIVAAARGIRIGAHDGESPAMHDRYVALGASLAEFPLDLDTAAHARFLGHPVVMGAPNVVHGSSTAGNVSALDVVAAGFCSALCSDYYLPAVLQAAFRVAEVLGRPIAAVWPLISTGPAAAVGLTDRGRIAPGLRADLVIVDDTDAAAPEVVATMAAGRLAYARAEVLPGR